MNICINCGTPTENVKFCSRSCNISFQNRQNPKRKPEGSCKKCGVVILSQRSLCDDCKSGNDMTLALAMYGRHHQSSTFAMVRTRARTILRNANRTACENCGYAKHVEAAHRKPISKYDADTLISVINHPNNLVALCSNCHWEFDNGLLNL